MNTSELLAGRTATSTWDSLVADLATLLDQIQPAVIATPHPSLDVAADHKFTTVALFEALERVGGSDRTLLLYNNHHVFGEYFPFGPADGLVTLPPWFDPELPCRGVYSHRLDEGSRTAKLFALDAMHDLRPAPRVSSVKASRAARVGAVRRALRELWRYPADYYSYFRRATRPNELFFVYSTADRDALTADFRDRWRSRSRR